RLPTRPRARKFDQDARDLADFADSKLSGDRPRLLLAHSMGGAIGLLCLRRHPRLFDAAILSSPMVGLPTGKLPPTLLRVITRPARAPGREKVVSPAAQRRAARLLPDCTLVELPESKHDPFLEHDRVRAYWFACIDRFIGERLLRH